MMQESPVIALLTDFGTEDSYVAEMKGVMLMSNPRMIIVDISHTIPRGDLRQATFLLWRSHIHFPEDTIFLSVVDPGVGGDRKIIILEANNQYFIAPDNGLLTLIADSYDFVAHEIAKQDFMPEVFFDTFHGRDIMAPACGFLTLGAEAKAFGPKVSDIKRINIQKAEAFVDRIAGEVLSIDSFGNVITSILGESLKSYGEPENLLVTIGRKVIGPIQKTFSSVRSGKEVAYIGSAGLLELAINEGDFAEKYRVKVGKKIEVTVNES